MEEKAKSRLAEVWIVSVHKYRKGKTDCTKWKGRSATAFAVAVKILVRDLVVPHLRMGVPHAYPGLSQEQAFTEPPPRKTHCSGCDPFSNF
jgi:hypothetical protein